jgi:hypothetical protein
MGNFNLNQRNADIVKRVTAGETLASIAANYGISDVRCSQIAKAAGVSLGRGANCPDRKGAANPSWKGGRNSRGLGYVAIYAPDHPRAVYGKIYEHIAVAERALGKMLPVGAQVHHINGDRSDNRPGNLVVCQDDGYHKLLHQRQAALEACGNADWRKCKFCKQYDSPDNLSIRKQVYHKKCAAADMRRRHSHAV